MVSGGVDEGPVTSGGGSFVNGVDWLSWSEMMGEVAGSVAPGCDDAVEEPEAGKLWPAWPHPNMVSVINASNIHRDFFNGSSSYL